MIYSISTKGCEISDKNLVLIERHLHKLSDLISKFSSDLPLLNLIIRWRPKKDFYEGGILLDIPKKRIYANFQGKTIEEAIQLGFERMEEEIKTYKGLHFNSNNDYPNKTTLEDAISKILARRNRNI